MACSFSYFSIFNIWKLTAWILGPPGGSFLFFFYFSHPQGGPEIQAVNIFFFNFKITKIVTSVVAIFFQSKNASYCGTPGKITTPGKKTTTYIQCINSIHLFKIFHLEILIGPD